MSAGWRMKEDASSARPAPLARFADRGTRVTGPQYDDHDVPPPPEDDWQPSDDAFGPGSFPSTPSDRLPVSRSRDGGGQGGGRGSLQRGGDGFRRGDGGRRDGGSDEERMPAADGFERVPPQDLAAEQSVLGGMLLSKDAIADVV